MAELLVCSVCGLPGASYCPTVESESGEALEDYIHPICYAKKTRETGLAETTALSTRIHHSKARPKPCRSPLSSPVSGRAKGPMRVLWVSPWNGRKHILRGVRRML